MGYAQFLFKICPDGKSSGGTSALLEGVCSMPIQLHAFCRAAAPPLNFHGFRFIEIRWNMVESDHCKWMLASLILLLAPALEPLPEHTATGPYGTAQPGSRPC
jgi:hypothetical protein